MKISELNKITVDDLVVIPTKALQGFLITLNDAIERRKEQDKNEFLEKVAVLANESGVVLDEVLLSPPRRMPTIRYRNPDEPSQGWSGRGRKPNWLLALIASGRKIEEFEV
ncbi:MAG: H-NS histone family protein [Methylococcales bacterium]|nr:H-NS histone family protein [Methylococcales bacterium]